MLPKGQGACHMWARAEARKNGKHLDESKCKPNRLIQKPIVWYCSDCLLEMPRCWLDSFIERRCYCGRRHHQRRIPFRISMIMAFVPLTWSCKMHTHAQAHQKPFPIENAPVEQSEQWLTTKTSSESANLSLYWWLLNYVQSFQLRCALFSFGCPFCIVALAKSSIKETEIHSHLNLCPDKFFDGAVTSDHKQIHKSFWHKSYINKCTQTFSRGETNCDLLFQCIKYFGRKGFTKQNLLFSALQV